MSDDPLVDTLLEARRRATLVDLPSVREGGLALHDAYRVARAIEQRRLAEGDMPRGWKIGFTNRSIWPRYGVHQPIWGRVWQSSLTLLDGGAADVPLDGLVQPRIEPEIVFGFRSVPPTDGTLDALVEAIDWVAHGVEIVHTHYAGWRFGSAADTVADYGLHGRLVVGPRSPVADWPDLVGALSATAMRLWRGADLIDEGRGAVVLDGPVQALQQWLRAMPGTSPDWHARAGEVVTTGTLTDAWPVAPGERWRTEPGDARLRGLELQFV